MVYMRATRWLLELCLQRRKKAPRELRKSETRSGFSWLACATPGAPYKGEPRGQELSHRALYNTLCCTIIGIDYWGLVRTVA